MADGLFTPHLDALDPSDLPVSFHRGLSRQQATAMVASGPSNDEVLQACKEAYHAHTNAVDQVTRDNISTSQTPDMQSHIVAMRQYNWDSRVAAPGLASPIYQSPTMAAARNATAQDGSFLTFFVGIEANADVIIGGVGGEGVGFPFPPSQSGAPLWFAYGGMRIATNIDVAINLNAGIFVEPPSEVAGDYLGIELSAEPIYEGPSLGLGIHLTPDLSKVRGFSLAVGVELGLLPFTAAVVYGKIWTTSVKEAVAALEPTGASAPNRRMGE